MFTVKADGPAKLRITDIKDNDYVDMYIRNYIESGYVTKTTYT